MAINEKPKWSVDGQTLSNVLLKDNRYGTFNVVTTWYDGSPMDDTKIDNDFVYTKYEGKYLRQNLQEGQILQKDTMAQMRALSPSEILLLKMGVYKHLQLNGYYSKGDTPAPLDYYISETSDPDDGGGIININGFKLKHEFNGYIDVSYYGCKDDGIFDNINILDKLIYNIKSFTTIVFTKKQDAFIISRPLVVMANNNWKDVGYQESSARKSINFISNNQAEIRFANTVPFIGIFNTMPTDNTGLGYENTLERQPNLLIYGNIDDCYISGLTLNCNYTNRGLPEAKLEHEHSLKIIGCYNITVRDIVTKESMGDGIHVTYAFQLVGYTGIDVFRGIGSLATNCYKVTLDNIKSYKHSRLGISIVGASNVNITNIYAEDIKNDINYDSYAGPGSVIDVETDISQSYYSGRGFSIAENVSINGVSGVNIPYGGIVQVQSGRNVNITNISYNGESAYGMGRIEGDYTENITLSNITMNGFFKVIGRFGAKNIIIDKAIINCESYSCFNSDGDFKLINSDFRIKNIESTGSFLEYLDNNPSTVTIENTNIELLPGTVFRGLFTLPQNKTLNLNGVKINSEDTTSSYSVLSRGLVYCASGGNKISIKNVSTNIWDEMALFNQANVSDVNSLTIRNTSSKFSKYGYSYTEVSNVDIDGYLIENAIRDSDASAPLTIRLDDNMSVNIKNMTIISKDSIGITKPTNFLIDMRTSKSSYELLSNCEFNITGLTIKGVASTGKFEPNVMAAGVVTNSVFINDAEQNVIRFTDVNVNGQGKNFVVTIPEGVLSVSVNTQDEFGYIIMPKQFINPQDNNGIISSIERVDMKNIIINLKEALDAAKAINFLLV